MGGFGPPSPPVLSVWPNPLNLGSTASGGMLSGTISMEISGGSPGNVYGYTISVDNPDFIIVTPPPVNGSAPLGSPLTWTIQISQTTGTYTGNITISTGAGTVVVPVSAIFAGAGTNLVANPTNQNFGQGKLDQSPTTASITLTNNTGGIVAVTALSVTGEPFQVLTAVPFNIPASGGTAVVQVECDWSVIGHWNDTLVITSGLGTLDVPLAAVVMFVISADILQGTSYGLVLGVGNTPQKANFALLNPAFDCVLVFNGSLYNNPGNEKVLRRVEVFFENVGVCTGLKADIKSWRSNLTPPAFDSATQTISIGTVGADLSEMSAFFDITLAGEIIVWTLTRQASTGPVSLLGFIPHFEDKGEKVENV